MYGRTCIFQIQSTMPNVLKTNAQLEKGQMPDVHNEMGRIRIFWFGVFLLCCVLFFCIFRKVVKGYMPELRMNY